MRRFASALGALALATFVSTPAVADCIPGTGVCASAGVTVGIPAVQVGGQVMVGIPPIVLPLPYAAPAAPPVPAYPPYEPLPPLAYAPLPARLPVYAGARPVPVWGSRLAFDVRIDGAGGFGGDQLGKPWGLGGGGVALRYRATRHFGLELGVDVLGGRDHNDHPSTEASGNLGGLVYVNPRSRAQLYFSGGLLADYAHATAPGVQPCVLHGVAICNVFLENPPPIELQYNHVGGYGGLGLEWFATRHIALHLDARGVVRQRIGGNAASDPEFTDQANGRTTNTSAGLVGSVGALIYF